MKDIPMMDRPREKLTRAGVSALGDNELVALVLGSGTRTHGALARPSIAATSAALSSPSRIVAGRQDAPTPHA